MAASFRILTVLGFAAAVPSEWRGLQEKPKTEAPNVSRTAVQARLAAIHAAGLLNAAQHLTWQ